MSREIIIYGKKLHRIKLPGMNSLVWSGMLFTMLPPQYYQNVINAASFGGNYFLI